MEQKYKFQLIGGQLMKNFLLSDKDAVIYNLPTDRRATFSKDCKFFQL